MRTKSSCCSSSVSCFPCFSARNNTSSPALPDDTSDALPSSQNANTKAESPTVSPEVSVKLHESETHPSSPTAFSSHGAASSSFAEGTSSSLTTQNTSLEVFSSSFANAANDNTKTVFPTVSSEDAFPTQFDPQTSPSGPHAAAAHSAEDNSSSAVLTVITKDDNRFHGVPSGGSFSPIFQREEDVNADEGDNVDFDHLEGLIKRISELLEAIKEKGKNSLQPKLVDRWWLPTKPRIFKKVKDFLSGATDVIKDVSPGDSKTIVRSLLRGMASAHLAATGLLVVANILERFEEVSSNQEECFRLLKEMSFLAKVVKQFLERSQLKEGMHKEIEESTELIVEGYIVCCSQVASSMFSKFFSTSINKEELGKLTQRLEVMYKHINIQMGIEIYDVIQCKKANLSRRYPQHAVGIEEAIREVVDLLDWGSKDNALAVIVHGFGGMGKTTLADAVFSKLEVKGCRYSKVQLFENIHSRPKIMELQKSVLRDLMGTENIPEIRKHQDGQLELSYMLEKVSAFIYIDNALDEQALGELLPEDLSTATKVRFFITARDKNVGKVCPMKTPPKKYAMRGMSSEAAMSLMKTKMFGDMQGKINSNQLNHIIEICGGIPLMLTLVAKALRFEDDKQKVYRRVMEEQEKLKGQTFGEDIELYFFAYDYLPQMCKDPFLDVCFFFKGWEWGTVANIVGESALEMLESRGLVTKDTNETVSIHDVILTLGCQKTLETRFKFTSASKMTKFLDHSEGIQNIKGIWLVENKDILLISASKLDSMYKSLRILKLGNLIKVEGKCKKTFENLIFFEGAVPHLPFDVTELKKVKYINYQPKDLKLFQMPPSLMHMQFDGRLHSHAFEISSEDLEQLKNLRVLRLISFEKLRKLPEHLGDLVKGLQELTLSSCKSIEELPLSISKLQQLKVLKMDYCLSLMRFPEDFGTLNSLQELNLQGCTQLKELPISFENLSSLRSLNLSSCNKLLELPHGIGNLTTLVNLSLDNCANLTNIPESIGRLKSLSHLMDMSRCSELRKLPDLFVDLGNLRELNLCDCSSLEKLPQGFGQLKYLVKLNLSKCISLEELCKDFHCLSSLTSLDLNGCENLLELAPDFHRLSSLKNLYLSGCKRLQNLTKDFHCLRSLQHLYLCECHMLEGKLMNNLVKMKTLQIMNIKGSSKLVDRWGEIQGEGSQAWCFVVYTGHDLSKQEKENILQKLLLDLDSLLVDKQGNQFHISDFPPNSLVMFHSHPDDNFPMPLIEEIVDDIQMNFQMIYIGKHFNKFPKKVKERILCYSDKISELGLMIVKLLLALDAYVLESWVKTLHRHVRSPWLERYNAEEPIYFEMEMIGDGNGGKYHSRWQVLSDFELEGFLMSKCKRYHRLQQLVETSQQSNIELLRELLVTPGEETIHKYCAATEGPTETCGVDQLGGKTILLEMRYVDLCGDLRLWPLTELYRRERERLNFEIISIPVAEESTILDLFERFSREIPWWVLNPWAKSRVMKYFLAKQCGWEPEDGTWYPNIIWIVKPNGRILSCKPSVFLKLSTWEPEAYPFTTEIFEALREREWNQLKSVSSLEFLFNHLKIVRDQVKEIMSRQKMICLYSGNRKLTSSTRNALMELNDSIAIIYIPSYGHQKREKVMLTDTHRAFYYSLEKPEMPQAEMEGMFLLNLSEDEAMRFWMRLSYLKEEINMMYGSDQQLPEMKRLLYSFHPTNIDHRMDGCMTFMDTYGKMVGICRKETVEWLFRVEREDKAKHLMQLFITVAKEKGIQTQGNSSTPHPIENMQTETAVEPKNVNIDFDSLNKYTHELLEYEQLHQLFEFNKEGGNSLRPNAPRHYWPKFMGFSRLKNFLYEGESVEEGGNSLRPNAPRHYSPKFMGFFRLRKRLKNFLHEGKSDEVDSLRSLAENLVDGIEEAHWAAAGLLLVADILERYDTVSANRNECLFVLDGMHKLALCVKQLKELATCNESRMSQQMRRATVLIVCASRLCSFRSEVYMKELYLRNCLEYLEDQCKVITAALAELEDEINGPVSKDEGGGHISEDESDHISSGKATTQEEYGTTSSFVP